MHSENVPGGNRMIKFNQPHSVQNNMLHTENQTDEITEERFNAETGNSQPASFIN